MSSGTRSMCGPGIDVRLQMGEDETRGSTNARGLGGSCGIEVWDPQWDGAGAEARLRQERIARTQELDEVAGVCAIAGVDEPGHRAVLGDPKGVAVVGVGHAGGRDPQRSEA